MRIVRRLSERERQLDFIPGQHYIDALAYKDAPGNASVTRNCLQTLNLIFLERYADWFSHATGDSTNTY
jgi:hypothetical protein